MDLVLAGQSIVEDHYRILRKGGGEAWIHLRAATVPATSEHEGFVIGVARDETRERESRMRRELAARIAVDLAAADDLESVLATAVTGFTVLFDGSVTLRVAPEQGDTVVLSPRGQVRVEQLPHPVQEGLLGRTTDDVRAGEKREGLLLAPASQRSDCRAWAQFDAPRLVPSDELIVGDLLAQALGQAVDRVVERRDSAAKQDQLEQAIESHRLIGQAVGILIERHRRRPPRPSRCCARRRCTATSSCARSPPGSSSRARSPRTPEPRPRSPRLRPWTLSTFSCFPTVRPPSCVAEQLESAGLSGVRVVREALAGEDDSEAHEWGVYVRTPDEPGYAVEFLALAERHDGWYDAHPSADPGGVLAAHRHVPRSKLSGIDSSQQGLSQAIPHL